MASIRKYPGSHYWYACYKRADGTRVQKTTKLTKHSDALRMADELERMERLSAQGAMTEAHVLRVASEMAERVSGQALRCITTEGWLRDWLDGKSESRAAATATRYRSVMEGFLASLGVRKSIPLGQLTPRDILTYRDSERQKNSARTVNLAVKTVSAALNAARRLGYITTNPAEALDSLPHRAQSKGIFSTEQVEALLAHAPAPDWYGMILAGYYTGARLRDVANLSWQNVCFGAHHIQYAPMKTARTGGTVTVPMHEQLESYLLSIAGQDKPGAVFPTLAGRRSGGSHGLSMAFRRIMRVAGIPDSEARPRADGRAVSRLSYHSFRHGLNSAMANRGIAQEVRQQFIGHASAEMNAHYTHHDLERLRAAASVVPALKLAPREG